MKSHCLPFSQIPHTTRLFADFLAYSSNVQPFYPRSPYFAEWMKEEAANISYYDGRRAKVAAVLERQNQSWDASPKTLSNLERLRKGAAAVVTGQQVGISLMMLVIVYCVVFGTGIYYILKLLRQGPPYFDTAADARKASAPETAETAEIAEKANQSGRRPLAAAD